MSDNDFDPMAEQETDELSDMDFVMSVITIPVHDMGMYDCIWTGFKTGERVKFEHGQKGVTLETASPEQKEKTAIFEFNAVVSNDNPFIDPKKPSRDHLNKRQYIGDDEQSHDITFRQQTQQGFIIGSKRASATKVLQGIVGRRLEADDIKGLSLMRMMLGEICPVQLLISVEDGKEGEKRNAIKAYQRPKVFNGQELKPIDVNKYKIGK